MPNAKCQMLKGLFVTFGIWPMAFAALHAESGRAAWLRYAPLESAAAARVDGAVPRIVTRLDDDAPVQRAEQELRDGVAGMLRRPIEPAARLPSTGALVVGTVARLRESAPLLAPPDDLPPDAYWLRSVRVGAQTYTVIAGGTPR